MSKKIRIFLILISISSCGWADGKPTSVNLRTDQKAALQIAEKEFVKKYGQEVLGQKPFQAKLEKGIWKVSGTFHCPSGDSCKGGVAEIEISEKSGEVISLTHGK